MAFSETGKIWMNGKMVDWKDATIHVATHALHYGSGVFEGIRAYDSTRGTNVFRLPEHMRRLCRTRCRIYRMDSPYTPRPAHRRRARDHPRQRLQGLLHPAAALPRLLAAGRQPAALPGRSVDHRVGMGRVSRRRGARQGRGRRRELVDAHRAEHVPGAGQGDRQLRQLRPDQDAGDAWTATPKASRSTSPDSSAKAAARTCSSCATTSSTRRR